MRLGFFTIHPKLAAWAYIWTRGQPTRVEDVNRRRRLEGCPEIRLGVGLEAGRVAYGNVGSPERLDFTVIGPAVNRAARLESLTKVLAAPL